MENKSDVYPNDNDVLLFLSSIIGKLLIIDTHDTSSYLNVSLNIDMKRHIQKRIDADILL